MAEPSALRALAGAIIKPGALLRVDRGVALFVTDDRSAAPALMRAGFDVTPRDNLLALSPTAALFPLIDGPLPRAPEEALIAQLGRLSDRPVTALEIVLLTRVIKACEPGGPSCPDADKRLRQLAAQCMRTGGGGALQLIARLIIQKED